MDILLRNLDAMGRFMAGTAAAVGAASFAGDFLRVAGTDGAATFLRTKDGELAWLGGTSMPGASASALTASLEPGKGNGLGLSIGSGYEWAAFLRRLGAAQALFVYEPEAGLVKMALSVCDLAGDLASGKLVLLTGSREEAGEALRRFLGEHLGYEPPGVLHPLATIGGERRNELIAAGEFIVRQALEARHGVVSELAGKMRERMGGGALDGAAAMLVTQRYAGERPLHALVGAEVPRLVLDRHGTCSVAGRLAFMVAHRPARILSDLFRAELGCIPAEIAVETWVPPLVGAGFWQPGRVPAARTFSPADRVVVHTEVHRILLEGLGVAESQIELRPLQITSTLLAAREVRDAASDGGGQRASREVVPGAGEPAARVVMVADLSRTDAASLGLELPTHQAVYAAAGELIAADYLTVNFRSAGDILRRALLKAGVREGGGATRDPAMGEPMLRMVRDVLIPALPVLTLARALVDQKVSLELVGDWPGLERGASGLLRMRSLAEFCGAADRWERVGAVVHLSPWGTVSPVVVEAAGRGVTVVAVRHASDAFGGSVVEVLGASERLLRVEGGQVVGAVKGLLRAKTH